MREFFQFALQTASQPKSLLETINEQIYPELDRAESFITAFLCVIQPDQPRITYASAGHTTALLWKCDLADDSSVIQFNSTGLPLGIQPQLVVGQYEQAMSPEDVLLVYSDGVTEAENKLGRVLGMQALIDIILAAHPAPADEQIRTILSAVDLHRGELPLRDDIALFLGRLLPLERDASGAVEKIIPFVFQAEKSSVRLLAIQVRRAADAWFQFSSPGARSRFLNELELSVSEIAANIVLHAYRDYPFAARIQGRITLHPQRICVDLIDSGRVFREKIGPLSDLPLQELPDSGYGLRIARRVLDVCRYTRREDGRNHWRLEKTAPVSRRATTVTLPRLPGASDAN